MRIGFSWERLPTTMDWLKGVTGIAGWKPLPRSRVILPAGAFAGVTPLHGIFTRQIIPLLRIVLSGHKAGWPKKNCTAASVRHRIKNRGTNPPRIGHRAGLPERW
jgi:hypothetical protein